MIQVDGSVITISTKTIEATLENGALVSLKNKAGREFLDKSAAKSPVLELVYRANEKRPVARSPYTTVSCLSLSDTCAEITFDAPDGGGVLTLTEDEETGELCVEPEVTSARHGVLAARYTLTGIAKGLRMVAPLYQGVDMEPDDPLLTDRRWPWPHSWEAGLCIFHDGDEGFWIHCRDAQYRAKSLYVNKNRSVSFDAEAWGPIDRSLSAGGIAWRINVFSGGWRVPAAIYRDWLWKAYDLEKEERRRPAWQKDIRLAISWAPVNTELLRALATKVDPKTVLIHVPHWRDKKYDQCYPDFTPTQAFRAYLRCAKEMGFHVMPHANSIDMDPTMPEYRLVQDFKYRELETGALMGWSLTGMPNSNKALLENRNDNVMVKVHPGLARWRAILAENIDRALTLLEDNTDAIFTDVTLCTFNLENCLTDNTTAMQGMNRLIDHISRLRGGIAVGGEGLNELTMQKLTFAQVHPFDHGLKGEALARTGGNDLNDFLFGRLCRSFAYCGLTGKDEDNITMSRIFTEHGAIPTLGVSEPADVEQPASAVARALRDAVRTE